MRSRSANFAHVMLIQYVSHIVPEIQMLSCPVTQAVRHVLLLSVIPVRCIDQRQANSVCVCGNQVVNATGPFVDNIRRLGKPEAEPMIMPSAGVHVTLPDYYSPQTVGMIVPKTKDGRVVFMLPWKGATIAGTTGRLTTAQGISKCYPGD